MHGVPKSVNNYDEWVLLCALGSTHYTLVDCEEGVRNMKKQWCVQYRHDFGCDRYQAELLSTMDTAIGEHLGQDLLQMIVNIHLADVKHCVDIQLAYDINMSSRVVQTSWESKVKNWSMYYWSKVAECTPADLKMASQLDLLRQNRGLYNLKPVRGDEVRKFRLGEVTCPPRWASWFWTDVDIHWSCSKTPESQWRLICGAESLQTIRRQYNLL